MRDFFEVQERARRRTALLVGLFLAAVVGIIVVVYLVAHFAIGTGGPGVDLMLLLQVALGVGLIVGLGAAYRTAGLSRGGPAVAELLGGRRLVPDTTDPEERKFLNVVEEMAIASGTPVPAIYILDGEDGINGFAAGHSTHDAAIAITRGALRHLTRDELQGVVAHEFSHILNGDMRLNIRLIGVLYGILLLAIVGRGILYAGPRGGGRRGRNGGGSIALVGLALLLVGYIGVFFGKMIKAAVSRQREYLADSSAVEFTRNPVGLAGALKKIGAQEHGSRIRDPHAEELSHLFFANGLRRPLASAFATHPPLHERIRRLDPSWNGEFGILEGPPKASSPASAGRAAGAAAVSAAAGSPTASPTGARSAEAVVTDVGSPSPETLAYAGALLGKMPEALVTAAHTTRGAMALVLALAMADSDENDLAAERGVVGKSGFSDLTEPIEEILPLVRAQGREARLPLLDLALPTLQGLSPDEASRFLKTVEDTVIADRRLRLFEYTMVHALGRRLGVPQRDEDSGARFGSFAGVRSETEALLSALAWTGSGWQPGAAEAALAAGRARLPSDADGIRLAPQSDVSIEAIDIALRKFQHATPAVQRHLLGACAEVVVHDREVTPVEMEMVRAIAEALDCPLPPLVT